MNMQKTEILEQDDHMHGMQHTVMTITSLTRPFDHIARLRGKVKTDQTTLWGLSNLAVRIELEAPTGKVRPISRIYTVRSFNPLTHEIEIDLVLHSDPSPAMLWLKTLQLGAEVSLIGPRIHINPNFEANKNILIFADDTAIPAVYAMLSQWPQYATAEVFVDTQAAEILNELPHLDQVNYHLVERLEPSNTVPITPLLDTLKQFSNIEHSTIWAACERREARLMRELCLNHYHLAKDDVRVFGYWKAGLSSSKMDDARLEHYSKLIQQGHGLAEFDDLDVNI